MKLKQAILVALVVLILAVEVSPCLAECILLRRELQTTYCDTDNWCWWNDGQWERLYKESYDCDGNGQADHYEYDIVQGNCCNL